MVTNAGSQSGPRRVALLLLTTVIGTAGCGSSVGPTDPGGAVQATEVGFERLEVAGVAFSRAGENIAQVTHDSDLASLAHDLLMSSQRHRANILDPDFRYVGIGVARTGETFWITQVFIAP